MAIVKNAESKMIKEEKKLIKELKCPDLCYLESKKRLKKIVKDEKENKNCEC
mgnify:CR=1 FL=1